MKVSHVLYKTNDLNESIDRFRKMGFKVDFGSKTRAHNALIYFSEGPYIELLKKAPVPSYINLILILLGKRKVVERFRYWENVQEGFFGLCLENNQTEFKNEEDIMIKHRQKFFVTKSQRTDPLNRVLKWRLLFPFELKLPFLMTYFNVCPKPRHFIHPNGIKGIAHIVFGTDEKLFPVIRELCDDERLELREGFGVQSITYEKSTPSNTTQK